MTVALAQVRSITDGDTIRATIFIPAAFGTSVVLDEGNDRGWPVRLLGVDAPEKSDHDAWAAATTWTAEHVQPGDWVTISSPGATGKVDSFRRVLAVVILKDGTDLGAQLEKAGHAQPWSRGRAAEFGFDGTSWHVHAAMELRQVAPPVQLPVVPPEARDRMMQRLRFAMGHGDKMAEMLELLSHTGALHLVDQWKGWRVGHHADQ